MTNNYRAATFKEIKKTVTDAVECAEMVQEYDKLLPEKEREQFQGLTENLFNVLEQVSLMLDDKVLFYNRKREKVRLHSIQKENLSN